MKQIDLFAPPPKVAFDGETYDHERDHVRLSAQLSRVYKLMLDGNWHTLTEIAYRCGASVPAASARLRDLRKQQYGSHTIERQYLKNGLYHYRMIRPEPERNPT